ncbi:Retrovirus-related Pol polyprotein [Thelohanellus kitauei]|uniref:Retrovirus-related Pol polyprotein n=1 Tax=Thelohanellus kitauei TaxID=669202 RepID=A0A0C2MDY4_THEKT|nr:Retrovirus-related Pol polyprotein [Thelohanellus kitauei]
MTNAPATCQRMMDIILSNIKNTCCYLDDVIIFSPDWNSHLSDVRQALRVITAAGLKLRKDKCQFGMKQIDFLGHKISKMGISVDPDRTSCFKSWRTPFSVKELQCFLGSYQTDFSMTAKS